MTTYNEFISIDAETNGLWGKAFQISAEYWKDGEVVDRFDSVINPDGEVDPWVKVNILPKLEEKPRMSGNYEDLLREFANWYIPHKSVDIPVVVHMGHVVEANLFRDMRNFGFIGDFDAPYVWIDLCAFPEVNVSVDSYAEEHNIKSTITTGTHDALYDANIQALVYQHLMNNKAQ